MTKGGTSPVELRLAPPPDTLQYLPVVRRHLALLGLVVVADETRHPQAAQVQRHDLVGHHCHHHYHHCHHDHHTHHYNYHLVGHVGRELAVGQAPDRDAAVGQPTELGLGQRDLNGDGDLEDDPVEEWAHLGETLDR